MSKQKKEEEEEKKPALARRILLFPFRATRSFFRWYIGLFRGHRWWFRLWVLLVSFIAFIIFYIFAVMVNLFWLFGRSPSAYDIMHPKNPEASEIYSADGQLIGKFFDQNRTSVPFDSISPQFFQALIDTEDERFYDHHGIDFTGLAAAGKDAISGHARGASTITQQLVKNMFRIRTQYSTGLLGNIPGVGILVKKSKEMIIAVELEMLNDKDDILMMYANTVDFGSNAFGIKTAAKTYFNTTPANLKVEESAVLVGLLKATSTYNPRLHPEAAKQRRNVVLENMCRHHHLTRRECDSLKRLPIELHYNVESAYDGQALYFREAVADYIAENCPDVDPYSDGLKIYTTIDMRMQRYAEQAVTEQMRSLQTTFNNHWRNMGDPWRDAQGQVIPHFIEDIAQRTETYRMLVAKYPSQPDSVDYYMNLPHRVRLFDYDGGHYEHISTMDSIRYMVRFLHTGFVAMEPQTGHVKAYVGDIDFKTWKYDKVKAMRQPGSTFKLFVYATAMKQGLTPADTRKDSYIRMEVTDARTGETKIWQPHNANGRFTNTYLPLRSAFAASVNTIAVNLGQEVGIPAVIETAHEMGIESPLDNVPSLPLGSSDVNLFEMVNAYATVANDGVHVPPVLVTKIVDREGHVIYEAQPDHFRALPYRAAFYVQQLLEAGVRDGGGTSQALGAAKYMGSFNGKIDFGGKTGTTNNHSDAWFIGVTPSLVGGAWVGGEYRSIHFRTGQLGQGSRTALPIFGLFMHKVLSDAHLAPRYLKRYAPPRENIDPATYRCTYVAPSDSTDSLAVDSLADEIVLDEYGEPITPTNTDQQKSAGETVQGSGETPASSAGRPQQPANRRDEERNFE